MNVNHVLRMRKLYVAGWRQPRDGVLVTRGTRFGNPFVGEEEYEAYRVYMDFVMGGGRLELGVGMEPSEMLLRLNGGEYRCGLYKGGKLLCATAAEVVELRERVMGLRGRPLVCVCRLDRKCHGDVLAGWSNGAN